MECTIKTLQSRIEIRGRNEKVFGFALGRERITKYAYTEYVILLFTYALTITVRNPYKPNEL